MKLLDFHRCWCSRFARTILFVVAAEMAGTPHAWSQTGETTPHSPADGENPSGNARAQQVDQPADVPLLPGGELSEQLWEFVSREKQAPLTETWQVQQFDGEAVLVCRGEPYGYLKTTRAFADFQLKIEWKFPFEENGNSGILLYTNGHNKDQVWPTAIQVQLHQPACGSIFRSGDAKSDNEIRDVRDVCKAVNQWNSCKITSVAGRLSVEMNGKPVGVVTGCQPNSGGIALQSEGSEVHFRRIRVTKLPNGNKPLPSMSLGPARCRCTRCVRVGSLNPYSFPGPTAGPVWVVSTVPVRPRVDRMNPHVVDRDRLARHDDALRARRRELLVVGPHAAVLRAHRRTAVRHWHRRELHR